MPEPTTRKPEQPKSTQSKTAHPSRGVAAPSQEHLSSLQKAADASAVVQRLKNVVQRAKYIWRPKKGIIEVADEYEKKRKERWSNEQDYLAQIAKKGATGAELPPELAERVREETARVEREAEEQRLRDRQTELTDRKLRAGNRGTPDSGERKQIHQPSVVGRTETGVAMAGNLIFRGMSPNNIKDFHAPKADDQAPVFIAENPKGTASATEHISEDSRESPYLSFETEGLGISAGKYAPKPVSAENELVGVTYEGGHLKSQKASYKQHNAVRGQHHRAGMVAGIDRRKFETEDYSTERKASALKSDDAQKQRDAREKAVADKEVLVKAGEKGIPAEKVPFIALIEEVSKDYYRANASNQTDRLALGYYKPHGEIGKTVYYKIYIPDEYATHFMFEMDDIFKRQADETLAEMAPVAEVTAPAAQLRRKRPVQRVMRSAGDMRADTRTRSRPLQTRPTPTIIPGRGAKPTKPGDRP